MTSNRSTPYQVFLHLMMVSMYIVTVVSFITLVVQYIDLIFPDELIWYGSTYDSIRLTSSIILVGFPVFILTTWLIGQDLQKESVQQDMAVRKWLIYLALFVAAITMVIDLIQFVNSFYSGELTTPFFLKTLTVFIVSALSFAYFRWDLNRRDRATKKALAFAVATGSSLLVILSFGFILAGGPVHQRQVRFDEERVQALQSIEYEIGEYWRQKQSLPLALEDLERDIYSFELPKDPSSGEDYEYQPTGELSFELCADFALETQLLPSDRSGMKQWMHEAGKVCFERSIDPDFYSQNNPYFDEPYIYDY